MASAQIDDLLFGYAIQFVLAEIAAGTNLGMTFSLPIEMTMPTIKAQLAMYFGLLKDAQHDCCS